MYFLEARGMGEREGEEVRERDSPNNVCIYE
jgi:hypothetical protein